jgi:predicted HTH domain antitoxin
MALQFSEAETRLAAAVAWYASRRLSSSAAAAFAGISRVEFLERLAEFGVSAFLQTPSEVRADYLGRPPGFRQ